jgi:site-specific recombinase XerD
MLRRFFNWAVKNNFCSTNPAIELPLPKLETKKPRYFSEEELSAIFDEAIEPYRTIFKFLYLTGLRIGELENLEWSDFNERQRYITIRVADGNKTKREEIVQLSSDALEILQTRKAANEHDRCIFVNAEGNQLDNDNIYRNLKRVLKRLKIQRASPHTFRHTCASHLVIRGVSIYTVKDILRHKSVKETEIYAHLSISAARNAVEMLSVNSLNRFQ